jgi:hypothetical protein
MFSVIPKASDLMLQFVSIRVQSVAKIFRIAQAGSLPYRRLAVSSLPNARHPTFFLKSGIFSGCWSLKFGASPPVNQNEPK